SYLVFRFGIKLTLHIQCLFLEPWYAAGNQFAGGWTRAEYECADLGSDQVLFTGISRRLAGSGCTDLCLVRWDQWLVDEAPPQKQVFSDSTGARCMDYWNHSGCLIADLLEKFFHFYGGGFYRGCLLVDSYQQLCFSAPVCVLFVAMWSGRRSDSYGVANR